MRRVAVFLILLFGSLSFGQKLDPTGKWVGNSYVDDNLGFSYTLPTGYKHDGIILNLLMTPGDDFLFVALAPSTADQANSIKLIVRDVRLDNSSSCDQIHALFEENLPVVPGTTLLARDREIRLGAKVYRRIDFKEKSGKQLHSYLCSRRRGYWLYWDIEAPSVLDRDNLVLSIAKIEYRDDVRDAETGK